MASTTADLIADVNVAGGMPDTNGLASPAEMLRMATSRLWTDIAALLIETRSEYWVTSADQTIVNGTASYRLPDRALANGLRDVVLRDPSGVEYDVVQRPQTDRYLYANGLRRPVRAPFVFVFENGKVVLLPTPTAAHAGWTLRLRYYERPSRLCLTSVASGIAQPSTTLLLILTDGAPSDVTIADNRVDIVRGDGMHEVLFADRIVDAFDSGTDILELSASTPIVTSEIAAYNIHARQDWVCPAGQTVFAPVPDAAYPVLVAGTLIEAMRTVGDRAGLAAAIEDHREKRRDALSQMVPRADGAVKRAIPRWSPLRNG